MPDITQMDDVNAGTYARYVVVAAKVPGVAIVRCQALTYPPYELHTMKRLVEQVVGRLNKSIEWTWHDYGSLPYYAVYDKDQKPPVGVFQYDYMRDNCYMPEGDRLDVDWPAGWITNKKEETC